MPIESVSERLELDISHLLWQARIYDYSPQQLNEHFDALAGRYIALVAERDLPRLELKLRDALARLAEHSAERSALSA